MHRRTALATVACLAVSLPVMNLKSLVAAATTYPVTSPMPVLFIGHGSPRNALWDNDFTRSLHALGTRLAPPKAIVVISAHWLTNGTQVTTNQRPPTVHDFGGFQAELHAMQYPAPGAPDLAQDIIDHVEHVHGTTEWGLDHGTWTVLHHLYPQADIPVLQLSIDYTKPLSWHFDFARQLRFLRERGILLIGSGNVVHNTRLSVPRLLAGDTTPFDWATEFDGWVKAKLDQRDFRSLVTYSQAGRSGQLAVPTPDHYVPLLYSAGLTYADEALTYPHEEVTFGAISMRTVQIG